MAEHPRPHTAKAKPRQESRHANWAEASGRYDFLPAAPRFFVYLLHRLQYQSVPRENVSSLLLHLRQVP